MGDQHGIQLSTSTIAEQATALPMLSQLGTGWCFEPQGDRFIDFLPSTLEWSALGRRKFWPLISDPVFLECWQAGTDLCIPGLLGNLGLRDERQWLDIWPGLRCRRSLLEIKPTDLASEDPEIIQESQPRQRERSQTRPWSPQVLSHVTTVSEDMAFGKFSLAFLSLSVLICKMNLLKSSYKNVIKPGGQSDSSVGRVFVLYGEKPWVALGSEPEKM